MMLFAVLGIFQAYYAFKPSPAGVQYYLDIIQKEGHKRGHVVTFTKIPIRIVDRIRIPGRSNIIGLCLINPMTKQRTILIDGQFWRDSIEDHKLILVAHEIGHCYYNLPHYDDTLDIMNSSLEYHLMLNAELWDSYFDRAFPYRILPIPEE